MESSFPVFVFSVRSFAERVVASGKFSSAAEEASSCIFECADLRLGTNQVVAGTVCKSGGAASTYARSSSAGAKKLVHGTLLGRSTLEDLTVTLKPSTQAPC